MTDPLKPRLAALILSMLPLAACGSSSADVSGLWSAALEGPGGDVVFGLDLRHVDGAWAAWLVNGEERITVPRVEVGDTALVLGMDHYDSQIVAALSGAGDARRLSGEWTKVGSDESLTRMPFHATPGDPLAPDAPTVAPGPDGKIYVFAGVDLADPPRYRVDFGSDDQPAVGVFELGPDSVARGTFMTTTGDYRYLAGRLSPSEIENTMVAVSLSCFDGAHAFLFKHHLDFDWNLVDGHFWSRDTWHDTYTGTPDPDASLPDGFALTTFVDDGDLGALAFPDLDGDMRALDDPAFEGKARILQVFGSWCPNCHDACDFLADLDAAYGERGLSIVGLAFEHGTDFERNARQVRRYAERHGVTWPLLIAGLSDKAEAGKVLPILDAVRSYPTTIFLHGDGRVRAVYQGFSGPATGAAHAALRASFEAIVEELLAE